MGGFNSINKYKQMNKEEGISSAKNSADSAVLIALTEAKANASIFNLAGSATTTAAESSSTATDYSLSSAQKWAIAGTALSGLAQLGANLFANSKTSTLFADKSKSNDVSTVKDEAVNISTIKTSNDLADAVQDYTKKSSSKHSANLTKELDKAKADKSDYAQMVVEQDSIISSTEKQKQEIKDGMKELETTKNEKQKVVDDIKAGLIKEADGGIAQLDENDKAQDKTISESQTKVSNAKKECDTTVDEQKNIISQNQQMANATATPVKDAQGNVTGWNPSQSQIDTAKAAVKKAEQAIIDAEKKRDEIIKAEETGEDSVQGKAKAQKATNAEEKATWEAKKQNPTSEALTSAKEEYANALDKLNTQQVKITEFETTIKTATLKRDKANKEMIALSQTILNAESLLSKGQTEDK